MRALSSALQIFTVSRAGQHLQHAEHHLGEPPPRVRLHGFLMGVEAVKNGFTQE